jgi:hypothetical protein
VATFTDDFNRANGGLGANWTTATNAPSIASNVVNSAASTTSIAYVATATQTFAADQKAQVTCGSVSASARYAGAVVRMASNNGYEVYTDGSSGAGHTEIARVTAGVETVLANFALTFTSSDTIGIEAVGTTLYILKNGVRSGSTTDATYATGQPGISAYDAVGLDNFTATDGAAAAGVGYVKRAGPGVNPDKGSAFTAPPRAIVSLATITGTSATTNANDTAVANGVTFVGYGYVKQPGPGVGPFSNLQFLAAPRAIIATGLATITGTSATTNANDTSSASGTTTVVGTLARTNANDTGSASGTTTIVGTLAKTNADDTGAASGTTTVLGTLAKTNANDTVAASGSVPASGSAAVTNANDTSAAAGTTTVIGTAAVSNRNDTSQASGSGGTSGVDTHDWVPPKKKKRAGPTEEELFAQAKQRLRQQITDLVDPPEPEIQPEAPETEQIPAKISARILPKPPEIPLPDTADDEIIAVYLEYEARQVDTVRAAAAQLLEILSAAEMDSD